MEPGGRNAIRKMLLAGHRTAPGRAPEVAALLLKRPRLTGSIVELLWDGDEGVANRAADALERASYHKPELLKQWKDALLGRMQDASANKLRWNLALMIPRVPMTPVEANRAGAVLRGWLDDRSSIVKTAAMHGLTGLARWNPALLPEVLDMLRLLSRSGTPAMRARGRILLRRLESDRSGRTLAVHPGRIKPSL